MRKLKEKVREKRWTIIGVAIGLALIIIGAILKQDSSELLGEILASIGIVIGLYILFRDQQGNMLKNQGGMLENQGSMLKNQEKMISILEGIRDTLRKG